MFPLRELFISISSDDAGQTIVDKHDLVHIMVELELFYISPEVTALVNHMQWTGLVNLFPNS